MNGRVAIPGGDAAHAIYKDQQQQYLDKKADKAKTDDHGDGVAPLPESPADILTLPPDRRFKLICHLTLPQLKNLRQSLSPEDRQRLTDGFTPQQVEAIAAFTGSGAAAMTPEEKDAVLEARLLHVPVSARTEQLIVAQTSADQQKQIGELRQVSAVGKGQDPLTMRAGCRQTGFQRDGYAGSCRGGPDHRIAGVSETVVCGFPLLGELRVQPESPWPCGSRSLRGIDGLGTGLAQRPQKVEGAATVAKSGSMLKSAFNVTFRGGDGGEGRVSQDQAGKQS